MASQKTNQENDMVELRKSVLPNSNMPLNTMSTAYTLKFSDSHLRMMEQPTKRKRQDLENDDKENAIMLSQETQEATCRPKTSNCYLPSMVNKSAFQPIRKLNN